MSDEKPTERLDGPARHEAIHAPVDAIPETNTENRNAEHEQAAIPRTRPAEPDERVAPSEPAPDQHTEASKPSPRIGLTWAGIFIALLAAVFSGWQACETRLSRIGSSRAWVITTNVNQSAEPFAVGNVFAPEIAIVNSGHSPALDGRASFYLQVEQWGSSYDYPRRLNVSTFGLLTQSNELLPIENNSFAVIGPNVQTFIPSKIRLTEEIVGAVKSGKARFLFHGWINYLDIFGERRTTGACFEWPHAGLSDPKWRVCPAGNWAQ